MGIEAGRPLPLLAPAAQATGVAHGLVACCLAPLLRAVSRFAGVPGPLSRGGPRVRDGAGAPPPRRSAGAA